MRFLKPLIGIFFLLSVTILTAFRPDAQEGQHDQSHYESSLSASDVSSAPISVDLLSETTALGDGKNILLALRFQLPPSWKMYAPSPEKHPSQKTSLAFASTGPDLSWDESENIKKLSILWPTPQTYTRDSFSFDAYEGTVIVPLRLEANTTTAPLKLKLHLKYSVCQNSCIPLEHTLSITLPAGPKTKTPVAHLLQNSTEKPHTLPPKKSEKHSYSLMILFAFLGGLILNFMPCVLPVISLKVMNIAKKSRSASERFLHFRPSFLATFAGIMTSFLCLGGLVVVLDFLGASVGWGLHFQQPIFLAFLIVLTTLFTSNLWGFYDIELPLPARDAISKFLGYEHEHHAGLVEDFFSGVFATLLATPCTAPFLGTALGYAFSRSGAEILLFFIVLGLGFSTPYWLGAILPRSWLKLPKPGAWMVTLSHVLGYVLAVTTLWLLWVLGQSTSFFITAFVGLGAVIMTLIFWIGIQKPKIRLANMGIAVFMLLFPLIDSSGGVLTFHSKEERIESFDLTRLTQLVHKKKTIVVDITASWCLTCQVNKMLIFNSEEGKKLFSENDIVLMRGDWTRHDPSIAQYLASYGRAGIPFNIVFGPHAPQGIILPEILNLEALRKAIFQAQKGLISFSEG